MSLPCFHCLKLQGHIVAPEANFFWPRSIRTLPRHSRVIDTTAMTKLVLSNTHAATAMIGKEAADETLNARLTLFYKQIQTAGELSWQQSH